LSGEPTSMRQGGKNPKNKWSWGGLEDMGKFAKKRSDLEGSKLDRSGQQGGGRMTDKWSRREEADVGDIQLFRSGGIKCALPRKNGRSYESRRNPKLGGTYPENPRPRGGGSGSPIRVPRSGSFGWRGRHGARIRRGLQT